MLSLCEYYDLYDAISMQVAVWPDLAKFRHFVKI